MEGEDWFAWNFYERNATGFIKDFGLMNDRINKFEFDEITEELFMIKLSLIHQSIISIHQKEQSEKYG
jgi:hypothetical protein